MNNNLFIWTESIDSLETCRESIHSFLKFHKDLHLNVFTLQKYIKFLPVSKNITYCSFSKNNLLIHLKNRFFYTHKKIFSLDQRFLIKNNINDLDRKSFLWAYILKKYKNYSLIVHFSNKIIFSDSALSYLLKKSYEYDLISTRILENKKRKYGKIMNYSYAVDQNFFLFKPSLVPSIVRINQYGLAKLIRGEKKGNGRLKVRFFAEICRELIANNGKFTEINKKYFESLPPTLI